MYRSLSALSDVVYALTQQHKHVPYRNSKLTYLLQDSLKVNSSKVLMFANISPAPALKHESIATLQFASKCRSVMLGHAKKNIGYSE